MDTPVDVVGLDYDFWYELGKADGALDPGEVPQELGEDQMLYYVRFRHALDPTEPTWPDSPGYPTVSEAMACAETKVKGGIRWHDQPAV